MEKLIALLQEKTGMSHELATQAALLSVQFFKERLPESLGAQLDAVLAGGDAASAVQGAITSKLGGLGGGLFAVLGGGGDPK